MNYNSINTAIITARDVPTSVRRDKAFYDYLLNNNVAYYYCAYLSKEKNEMDKKIIKAGAILHDRFFKTLKLLNDISRKNNIHFLLFKTYKYIPEVVDGDIDLFIQEKDFYTFLEILRGEGFYCFENERLKAFCKKDGFCTLEPRVNLSFHGLTVLDEGKIWEKIDQVEIDGFVIQKAAKEIDLLHPLLNILYGPNYLKLYQFLLYKDTDIRKFYELSVEKYIYQDFQFLIRNLITENVEGQRFPLFMNDIRFLIWWCRRILSNVDLSLFIKFKHLLFFFYVKYWYMIFNKLVFRHQWPLL